MTEHVYGTRAIAPLKKVSSDVVDAFQAYTLRNLNNKVSTSSDIEQYKLLHITEDPLRCNVLLCAVSQWEVWRVPSSEREAFK